MRKIFYEIIGVAFLVLGMLLLVSIQPFVVAMMFCLFCFVTGLCCCNYDPDSPMQKRLNQYKGL